MNNISKSFSINFALGIFGVFALIVAPVSYIIFNGYNLPYEPLSVIHILMWLFILFTILRSKHNSSFVYRIVMPFSILLSLSIILISNTASPDSKIYDLREIANYEQFKKNKEVQEALELIYKDRVILKKEEWYFYSILNKL